MKKLIYLILILTSIFSKVYSEELLNLGSISFEAVNWTQDGDILYSRNNIQDLTSQGKPVAIQFFTSECSS